MENNRTQDTPRGDGHDRKHWHLDKTLNLSHLLTTVAIAGSLFAYASGMDKRVVVLEEKMQAQAVTNRQTGEAVRDLATEMKHELRQMNGLLLQLVRENVSK